MGRAGIRWPQPRTALLFAVACGGSGTPGGSTGPGATPPPVATVTVTPATAALPVGDTVRLTATLRDASGQVLSGRTVTWSSVDPAVATVSGSGLVTAVAAGAAQITASAEGRSGTAQVNVSGGLAPVAECASPGPGWIWCDDFETNRLASYFEYDSSGGDFVRRAGVGRSGSMGMRAHFDAGQVAAGALHLAMGKVPLAYFRPVDAGTALYRDVYWRVYVRTDSSWTGGGGYKLSRAFSFAAPTWAQAMIAHVWSGSPPNEAYLVIDPASGTDSAGALRTTGYNDFANLRFIGSRRSTLAVFAPPHLGVWHCIEAQARLNDAGQLNGAFRLWIDGTLQAERTDLNWLGSFSEYAINAVYLENYWNGGSPQAQDRSFDNFVVSTQRIGC